MEIHVETKKEADGGTTIRFNDVFGNEYALRVRTEIRFLSVDRVLIIEPKMANTVIIKAKPHNTNAKNIQRRNLTAYLGYGTPRAIKPQANGKAIRYYCRCSRCHV